MAAKLPSRGVGWFWRYLFPEIMAKIRFRSSAKAAMDSDSGEAMQGGFSEF